MTTSIFYPDAHPETTSVDGYVQREYVSASWASTRGGAGTLAEPSHASLYLSILAPGFPSYEWYQISRSIILFDTSALGSDLITAATISLEPTYNGQSDLTDTFEIDIVSSTPASDTDLVTGDYSQLGSTPFASRPMSDFNSGYGGYVVMTLDSNGIANINGSGISKFGIRFNFDTDNTEPTWAANGQVYQAFKSADAGSNAPKLTVTHAPPSAYVPKAIAA